MNAQGGVGSERASERDGEKASWASIYSPDNQTYPRKRRIDIALVAARVSRCKYKYRFVEVECWSIAREERERERARGGDVKKSSVNPPVESWKADCEASRARQEQSEHNAIRTAAGCDELQLRDPVIASTRAKFDCDAKSARFSLWARLVWLAAGCF